MKRQHLSIGEVLELLVADFPDITISKIRFLESKGLISPERTPSGYRRFYVSDVDRLKSILLLQKEHYLPLDVIKVRLESGGELGPAVHSQLSLSFVQQEETRVETGLEDSDTFGGKEIDGTSAVSDTPDNVTALTPRSSSFGKSQTAPPEEASDKSSQTLSNASGVGKENLYGQRKSSYGVDPGENSHFVEDEKYSLRATNVALGMSSHAGVTFSKLSAPSGISNSTPVSNSIGVFGGNESNSFSEREAVSEKESINLAPVSQPLGQGYSGVAFVRPADNGHAGIPNSSRQIQTSGSNTGRGQAAFSEENTSKPTQKADQAVGKLSPSPEIVDTKPPAANQVSSAPSKQPSNNSGFDLTHSMYSKEELLVAAEIDTRLFAELLEYGLITAKRVAGEQLYDDRAVKVAALVSSYAKFGIGPRHLRSLKHAAEREASMYQQSVVPFLRQRNPDSRRKALDNIESMTQLGKELKDCLLRIEIDDILGGKTS